MTAFCYVCVENLFIIKGVSARYFFFNYDSFSTIKDAAVSFPCLSGKYCDCSVFTCQQTGYDQFIFLFIWNVDTNM